MASTIPGVLGKQNRVPPVIDVDVDMPVEPCKSSRVANLVKNGPSRSQSPTAARLPRPTTKLMQTKMEKNTAGEFQSQNRDVQPVHCTALRTELGVFDDSSASELQLFCCPSTEIVKDVPQDWIFNSLLPSGLLDRALEHLYVTNCPFL